MFKCQVNGRWRYRSLVGLELRYELERIAGVPEWSLGPMVTALQALKGVGLVIAATLVAEVGWFSPFANPRKPMAYLNQVPNEHPSGGSVRLRGITKVGNTNLRALPVLPVRPVPGDCGMLAGSNAFPAPFIEILPVDWLPESIKSSRWIPLLRECRPAVFSGPVDRF